MSSRGLIAWMVLVASVSAAPAFAYKIYPLLGRNDGGSEPPPSLADAVHEDITLTAISCANDFERSLERNSKFIKDRDLVLAPDTHGYV